MLFRSEDPHMQAMSASMAGPDDLIFIISYSGSTKDNVYVAEIARQAGAKIVGITRFLKSPLTNYMDVLLTCGANEGPLEGGSMSAKMSQLYIIDILFQEYYRKNLAVSRENNKKTLPLIGQDDRQSGQYANGNAADQEPDLSDKSTGECKS